MNHQVVDETRLQRVSALLTSSGYSPDEAAEIALIARKNAFPDQWIKVLARAGAERARYRQALALAFPSVSLTASAARV
jgi:hypothetical protein